MGDVQVARYSRALQVQFGLRQMHVMGTLVPDVLPTVNVDNPPPEMAVFQGVDLCAGRAELTAAAAEYPTISLASHPQRVIIVESVWIASATAQTLHIGFQESIAGAAGSSRFRDTRRNAQGTPGGAVRYLSDPAAPLTTSFFDTRCVANAPIFVPLNVTLTQRVGTIAPQLLSVMGNTVATSLFATFIWRERLAQPDELAAL